MIMNYYTINKIKGCNLRARRNTNTWGLYLDINFKGIRERQNLNLTLPADFDFNQKKIKKEHRQIIDMAKKIQLEKATSLSSGMFIPSTNITLELYSLEHIQEGSGQSKFTNYNRVYYHKLLLEHYIGKKRVSEITPQDCQSFLSFLENRKSQWSSEKMNQNTVWAYFGYLKALLKKAYERGLLVRNPIIGIRTPKKKNELPKYLEISTLTKIKRTEYPDVPIVKTAWEFCYDTGSALIDMMNAVYENIKPVGNNSFLYIYHRHKTGVLAKVPIWPHSLDAIGYEPGKTGYIFPRFSRGKWKYHLDKWRDLVGVHFSWHSARHSLASHLASQGVPLLDIRDVLGHTNTTQSQVYAKLYEDASTQRILKAMEVILNDLNSQE